MSAKLIADVIDNCGIDFNPTDCMNVNDECILKVTLKCFKQMAENALPRAENGQTGGAQEQINTVPIFHYMTAYNINKLTRNTLMPVGILSTVRNLGMHKSMGFNDKVKAGSILSAADIRHLNAKFKLG